MIVSLFPVNAIWVNSYVSGISLQARTGEQEAQECLQLASSLHQASLLQQRLLSQFRV